MKLAYYGGSGFLNVPNIGEYEVRFNEEVVFFNELDAAIRFYDNLEVGKAIWDVSGLSELLSCHVEEN